MSQQVMCSRLSCHNALKQSSPCPRSRCTGPCAGSIRRRSCITWSLTVSPSPARARKSWSGCVMARLKSVRWPAPGHAGRHRRKIVRLPKSCWPTRRNWPNTLCCSISVAMTLVASPRSVRSRSPTSSSWNTTARSCTSHPMWKASLMTSMTPSTHSVRAFLPVPCLVRPKCVPWKSSTSWKAPNAASMPVASDTFPPPGKPTPASSCARHWSRTARCSYRQVPV